MAESATTAANRWRQSSPIRSPWDVKQRLRLLRRGFFSQVVNVQLNKMGGIGGSSPLRPGAPDSGSDNETENELFSGVWPGCVNGVVDDRWTGQSPSLIIWSGQPVEFEYRDSSSALSYRTDQK
ncbi:uncharacterized protein LOC124315805 [Daphnia pulicaria]|uniref:uncharacterized protein LOC124315805 n=1 Tax=Daphnia pulicaria TaxID=35523 RepID=UPI001EEAEC94|nr:uncharacterized protein LOC124315805 [Daphnia pulicaria]